MTTLFMCDLSLTWNFQTFFLASKAEIRAWVDEHRPCEWLALDDLPLELPVEHVVRTDPFTGFPSSKSFRLELGNSLFCFGDIPHHFWGTCCDQTVKHNPLLKNKIRHHHFITEAAARLTEADVTDALQKLRELRSRK